MLKLMRAPAKYIQGKDALLSTYDETKNLGKSFLFICSRSGEKACRAHLEQSFAGKEAAIRFEIFGGHSSEGEIQRMRDIVRAHGIDCVAGVGGGSAIDTAKATAYYEGLPVLVIPTVSATDAPCTGLSVIYKDDGSFSKYLFYPKNPDVVLVDSTVIANAPVKFLVAGMGDALGTYFEARMCARAKAPSLENGGITRSALALCRLCYETLLENGARAKAAVERHLLTPDVEAIIEANIYLSGVGADNGGLCVAHSVYNGFTAGGPRQRGGLRHHRATVAGKRARRGTAPGAGLLSECGPARDPGGNGRHRPRAGGRGRREGLRAGRKHPQHDRRRHAGGTDRRRSGGGRPGPRPARLIDETIRQTKRCAD